MSLDHVFFGVGTPLVEPVEALLAHAFWEDCHTAACHDFGNCDAAAGVVASRWPHRPVHGRIELARDDTRSKTRIGSQHLMGRDHREPVAEDNDDGRRDAGQSRGEHDVFGYVDAVALQVVVPVASPEVAGIRALRVSVADFLIVVERRRIGQLSKGWQRDALLAKSLDAVRQRFFVDHAVSKAELVFECVGRCGVSHRHLYILSTFETSTQHQTAESQSLSTKSVNNDN